MHEVGTELQSFPRHLEKPHYLGKTLISDPQSRDILLQNEVERMEFQNKLLII